MIDIRCGNSCSEKSKVKQSKAGQRVLWLMMSRNRPVYGHGPVTRRYLWAPLHLFESDFQCQGHSRPCCDCSSSPFCVRMRIIQTEQYTYRIPKVVARAVCNLVSEIEKDASGSTQSAELETLRLLEWKDVCKQVSSFCRTPFAAQQAWNGFLLIGKTIQESEQLLEQTREAGKINLRFGKIYDIQRAVAAAQEGRILHPMLLAGIVTTLRSARDIEAAINEHHDSGIHVPTLREVSKGISGGLGKLQASISECISVSFWMCV